eukprot:gb/GEZN01011284.1/.p1 GENE.gb/GEZN01011284.1/~~gb/GEZN01011284.1/.p1  ORF type:complete len:358 (+),score=51.75 gb/GEZN01011284.1/:90-1076(+)
MSSKPRKVSGGASGKPRRAFNEASVGKPEKGIIATSDIKNKQKRAQIHQKQKAAKKQKKRQARAERQQEAEALGEGGPPKKKPKTLENTREADETLVAPEDEEIKGDEAIDEFAQYFSGGTIPKICLTTTYKPTKPMFEFIQDLLEIFPNSYYYKRLEFPIKTIVEEALTKGWTDVIILNENRKKINALTHIHLPHGPTAYYKLSSLTNSKDIPDRGNATLHHPEVILNNFNTRLGHRVGRMLASLFHQEPNFTGRRVATFHNQRDFIFFRHHRYIFESGKKARLQELGPRFTLKLQWIQHGTFDTLQGEYEWMHKKELDTSRRRFFL